MLQIYRHEYISFPNIHFWRSFFLLVWYFESVSITICIRIIFGLRLILDQPVVSSRIHLCSARERQGVKIIS